MAHFSWFSILGSVCLIMAGFSFVVSCTQLCPAHSGNDSNEYSHGDKNNYFLITNDYLELLQWLLILIAFIMVMLLIKMVIHTYMKYVVNLTQSQNNVLRRKNAKRNNQNV